MCVAVWLCLSVCLCMWARACLNIFFSLSPTNPLPSTSHPSHTPLSLSLSSPSPPPPPPPPCFLTHVNFLSWETWRSTSSRGMPSTKRYPVSRITFLGLQLLSHSRGTFNFLSISVPEIQWACVRNQGNKRCLGFNEI